MGGSEPAHSMVMKCAVIEVIVGEGDPVPMLSDGMRDIV